jgi:hypothetical protein
MGLLLKERSPGKRVQVVNEANDIVIIKTNVY